MKKNYRLNKFAEKTCRFAWHVVIAGLIASFLPYKIISFLIILIIIQLITTFYHVPYIISPRFEISYMTKQGWEKKKFNKHTWNKIPGLNEIEKAYLYYLCLISNPTTSYQVEFNTCKIFIWGLQSSKESHITYYQDWGASRPKSYSYSRSYRKPRERVIPENPELMRCKEMTEGRLLLLVNMSYKNVEKIEDIYNLRKRLVLNKY